MTHKKQHIIPQAYLKYFSNDNKVFVFQLNDKYKRDIQEKGIGDKIFCDYKNYYYNFPNRENEPILEKMFGRVESNDYETIISRLESKANLDFDTQDLIINWVSMMKMRNSFFRDTYSRNISWTEKTIMRLKTKQELTILEENEIEKKAEKKAKAIQLSAFFNNYKKYLKEYFVNFMYKDWIVLESEEDDFLTTDNPGFSVTLSYENFLKGINSLSPIFNLDRNSNAIHYFPLSKDYCLTLLPIFRRIDRDKVEELTHSKINIEKVHSKEVDQINEMTIKTSYKLVIGNKSSDLIRWKDLIEERFK